MWQIQPGPCQMAGYRSNCPAAGEMDCVEVLKVYDQCLKEEVISREFSVPGGGEVAPTDSIACEIISPDSNCEIIKFSAPDQNNLRQITIRLTLAVKIRVFTADGQEKTKCAVNGEPFQVIREVVLFAPDGTFGQCRLAAANCKCDLIPAGTGQAYLCKILFCAELKVKAPVSLLMPAYGFCVPTPCEPAPFLEKDLGALEKMLLPQPSAAPQAAAYEKSGSIKSVSTCIGAPLAHNRSYWPFKK